MRHLVYFGLDSLSVAANRVFGAHEKSGQIAAAASGLIQSRRDIASVAAL
jgi:hypothetical protein